MAAVRMDRSETGHQFLIPRPKENSWGNERVLDKERIIREFVGFTPIMNQREDEECMSMFLDKIIVNGVQDPGLTPFEEFLPRSAPLARVRLNPEKCPFFLDRLAADPKWQISSCGFYDSLRLVYLRFFNEEARMVELMELRT